MKYSDQQRRNVETTTTTILTTLRLVSSRRFLKAPEISLPGIFLLLIATMMAMFNTAVIENGMAYNAMNTNLKYIIAVPAPNFTSKSTMQYIFCWYSSKSVARRVGVWTLIAITHITKITNTQVLVVKNARNGNFTASERSKVIATIVRTETMMDISARNGNIRQNIMPGKSLKSHLYPNNKVVMTRGTPV